MNVESNALTQIGEQGRASTGTAPPCAPAMTGLSRSGELHALAQSVVDPRLFPSPEKAT